eukprot:1161804-Pelagomonas_calceolata.AAC.6
MPELTLLTWLSTPIRNSRYCIPLSGTSNMTCWQRSKVFSSLDVMLRRDQSRFLDLFRRASRKPPGHMPATDPYGSYGHSSSYSATGAATQNVFPLALLLKGIKHMDIISYTRMPQIAYLDHAPFKWKPLMQFLYACIRKDSFRIVDRKRLFASASVQGTRQDTYKSFLQGVKELKRFIETRHFGA